MRDTQYTVMQHAISAHSRHTHSRLVVAWRDSARAAGVALTGCNSSITCTRGIDATANPTH